MLCQSAARKALPATHNGHELSLSGQILKHQESSGPLHVILTHFTPFLY
jgi:hypothetical protein